MTEFAEQELVDDIDGELPDDDVSDVDDVAEPVEGEQPEAEAEADDDGEVEVTFGDAAPADETAEETPVIREMRRKLREAEKERKALQKQIAERDGPAKDSLREKPTLAAHDYDQDAFEADLLKWAEDKRDHETKAKAVTQEWDQKVQSYVKAKASLKASDYPEAEAAFMAEIDANRQGMLLDAVERPELVILALGRNPEKLAEIAAITNPVKYAAALARLETQMKVGKRKAPAPERKVVGSTTGSTVPNRTLEQLEAEALRTGDRTKVLAFKRNQK
jgi:hypothetical protein